MIYFILKGAEYKDLGYMRGDPREEKIKKHFAALRALGVEIHGHTHQFIQAKRKVKVDETGIHLQ